MIENLQLTAEIELLPNSIGLPSVSREQEAAIKEAVDGLAEVGIALKVERVPVGAVPAPVKERAPRRTKAEIEAERVAARLAIAQAMETATRSVGMPQGFQQVDSVND